MNAPMYAVEVRDHIMVAHSLSGEVFGPAQNLHGATYVVDVAFLRETLTKDEIVVDIGRAQTALRAVLEPINYANLDDLPQFRGKKTTTEFLCKHIFDEMVAAAQSGKLGLNPKDHEVQGMRIRVTLNESHVARAWYEGPVGLGTGGAV